MRKNKCQASGKDDLDKKKLHKGVSFKTFPAFMENEIQIKNTMCKYGTARAYICSLSRLRDFGNDQAVSIDKISADLIEGYEKWLSHQGVCQNTISFYMRPLRAVHTRMVKAGLAANDHPFDDVYTGVARTKKRAISETDMHRIKSIALNQEKDISFYRDMFMLSFYLMGISFVDLARLKKTDIQNEVLCYHRAKTGQEIKMSINSKIRRMLKKHPSHPESPYLLPIIKNPAGNERKQCTAALRKANRYLKIIAAKAGVTGNVTTYTSRHSWASIAKARNIDIATISEALGHQNEATTRIYLATLDTNRVDHANEII